MATIEQRLKQFTYKKHKNKSLGFKRVMFDKDLIPKSKDIVFFICDEIKPEYFKQPFFNPKQIINLYDGVKFLTYCGKDQRKNINKNALVIQKKLSKDNKVIYKAYLMDKDGFNIRKLFKELSFKDIIGEHNGWNLSPSHYLNSIKENYTKEEVVYLVNKICENLTGWSLKQ